MVLAANPVEYEWLLALVVFFVMLVIIACFKSYAWAGFLLIAFGFVLAKTKDRGEIGASASAHDGKKASFRVSGPASVLVIGAGTVITLTGIIYEIPPAWNSARNAAVAASNPLSLVSPSPGILSPDAQSLAENQAKLATVLKAARQYRDQDIKKLESANWIALASSDELVKQAALEALQDDRKQYVELRDMDNDHLERLLWTKAIETIDGLILSVEQTRPRTHTATSPSTYP